MNNKEITEIIAGADNVMVKIKWSSLVKLLKGSYSCEVGEVSFSEEVTFRLRLE